MYLARPAPMKSFLPIFRCAPYARSAVQLHQPGQSQFYWLRHATFMQCIVNLLLQLLLLLDLDFLQASVGTINLRPLARHGSGHTPSVVLQEI